MSLDEKNITMEDPPDAFILELRDKAAEMSHSFLPPIKSIGVQVLKITVDGQVNEKDTATIEALITNLMTFWNLIGLVAALLVTCTLPNMDRDIPPSENVRPADSVQDPVHRHNLQVLPATAFKRITNRKIIDVHA
jgi:hypothetical protein